MLLFTFFVCCVLGWLDITAGHTKPPHPSCRCQSLRSVTIEDFGLYTVSEAEEYIPCDPIEEKPNRTVCFPECGERATCCTKQVEDDLQDILSAHLKAIKDRLSETEKKLGRLALTSLAKLEQHRTGIRDDLYKITLNGSQKDAVHELSVAFAQVFNGFITSTEPGLRTYYHKLGLTVFEKLKLPAFSTWYSTRPMTCDSEICTLINWTLPIAFPGFDSRDPLKNITQISCSFDNFLLLSQRIIRAINGLKEILGSIRTELAYSCKHCRKSFLPKLLCHLCRPGGHARRPLSQAQRRDFLHSCHGRIFSINEIWNKAVLSTVGVIQAIERPHSTLCSGVATLQETTERIVQLADVECPGVKKDAEGNRDDHSSKQLLAGALRKLLHDCCHTRSIASLVAGFFDKAPSSCESLREAAKNESACDLEWLSQAQLEDARRRREGFSLCSANTEQAENQLMSDSDVLKGLLDLLSPDSYIFRPFSSFLNGSTAHKHKQKRLLKKPRATSSGEVECVNEPPTTPTPTPGIRPYFNDELCEKDMKFYSQHEKLRNACCTNRERLAIAALKSLTKENDKLSENNSLLCANELECSIEDHHPVSGFLPRALPANGPDS
eukprot:m.7119 g.7119  ORF g.7119 m.7119 type:complete len:610 (+) comp17818_c0_seq2:64-1893(+)